MNKNFILTGLVTTVVNLILHAGTFFVFFWTFFSTKYFFFGQCICRFSL